MTLATPATDTTTQACARLIVQYRQFKHGKYLWTNHTTVYVLDPAQLQEEIETLVGELRADLACRLVVTTADGNTSFHFPRY